MRERKSKGVEEGKREENETNGIARGSDRMWKQREREKEIERKKRERRKFRFLS